MNQKAITELKEERNKIARFVKQEQEQLAIDSEKLRNLDTALESLKVVYPELFDDLAPKLTVKSIEQTIDPEWDYRLPFRRRVKELLKSMGRFTKASELAKIVYSKED